jgi:hypothetical protein
LNFSTSYNPYASKQKLSTIGITGTSPVIKGLNINYNGTINPYALDSLGSTTSEYYWKKHRSIGRLTNAGLSFGYSFQSGGSKDNKQGGTGQQTSGNTQGQGTQPDKKEEQAKNGPVEDFTYFKIPWSLTFNYTLSYSKAAYTKTIVQSLTFNGNVSLTNKWAISYSSGYDFKAKDFSVTSFTITRNLHCWTMSISCIPFGTYRYYEFKISALSQFLSDLKYEQRRDYYDYSD